ncbi:hypothetical protein B0A53_03139 [Rhodotorula sp. CCFEE 5036]|nr:hypothetical protein B0A53_03139 [Rhodotorula sp. CCFEE 5036]
MSRSGGYSLGRIIGEGTFGKVRLGVHRLTGTRVAIKQVPKSLPSYSPSDPSSPLSLLTREIHHHRRLRHAHVLSLFELVATESSIYLVTELCAGGELFDYLVEQDQARLSLPETRRIFAQLVLGVAYLHGEGVVHRDLKLENVLLDENVNVKIADLGFGREFEKGRFMDTRVGTLGYMAPEVVAGQRYLGEEVDIWSLGVILYALLTGSLPFDDDDEGVMRQLILECKYQVPSWLDPDAASLVRSILVLDPLRRASLKDILSHRFFTRPSTSKAAASSSSLFPASPLPPSPKPPLLNSPGLGLSDSGNNHDDHTARGPTSSPPTPLLPSPNPFLSEVQRGKQRAMDLPVEEEDPGLATTIKTTSASASPPSSYGFGRPPSASRPSALPPHMASAATASSPTPRIRRHPSTASIDFGPSAPPAPSSAAAAATQLFLPPAMQRTSSAGAVSVSSLRTSMTAAGPTSAGAGAGAGPGSGGTGRRRRSVGSVRSLRMQELSEGEESASAAAAISPARGGLGHPTAGEEEEDLSSAVAQQRRPPVASSVASVDEDGDESLNGEGAEEEPIDYVSLLLTTSAAPPLLSTPEEQRLLQQLSLLGFDTGQVSHSVRTSACDSCSATWWMLRRKREAEVEREDQAAATVTQARASSFPLEGGGDGGGESGGEGKLSRTNSLRSIRRYTGSIRDPAAVLNDPPDDDDASSPPPPPPRLYRDEFLEILTEEQGPLSPLPMTVPLELVGSSSTSPSPPSDTPPLHTKERTLSRGTTTTAEPPAASARAPSPPHTPPRRPSVAPVTPAATLTSPTMVNAPATPSAKSQAHHGSGDDAEARLSFFLNAAEMPSSASASAILSYFPTVDPPSHHSSPTAKRTGLSQSLSHNSLTGVGVGEHAPSVSGGGGGGGEELVSEEGYRGDRARAGSVSLLARATTAIGQGLASLSQTGTAADDAEGEYTPRQSSSKLPVPQASRSAASTTATPSPNLGNKPLEPSPSRPVAVHASASAPMAMQGYAPVAAAAVSPSPRPAARLVVSSSPAASPARSTSLRTLPLPAATKLPPSSSAVNAGQQRQALGRSVSSASTNGGGSKKNKGGNLLTTFKHWFGQDPRKRKRVSMSPRLGAVGSDNSTPSGGGVSVGRSHSMYVASTPARASAPLAIAGGRPPVGSRKSSYNSAYAGAPASAGSAATMSRRSSVSSAHRGAPPFLFDHAATPMRNNGGQPRRRRLSDASRTSRNSLSERGDNSRPSSVRSYGGPGGGSATRRQQHRHSTGGASSSPSGSYITAKEMYRRPPTTTTVRRRHGSRGRPASEMAATSSRQQQHRRTASGTSSIHRSSSGSMIAGGVASDDDDYVDEEDVGGGEDPIMEEDEEEGERTESAEQTRDVARAKALRVLSGGDENGGGVKVEGPPSSLRPPLVSRSSSSSPALSSTNTSLRSSTAPSSSHYHATTFTAHKTTHLFGSPLQPHAATTTTSANALLPASSSLSRRATIPVHAAAAVLPRRDVFAPKETTSGDWVDEDDELAGYGGGLGQGNTNAAETAAASLDRSSSSRVQQSAAAASKSGPQVSPGLGPSYVDSPVAGKVWSTVSGGGGMASGASAARFESRYAGIAGAALSPPGSDPPMLGTTTGGLASAPRQSKWAQAAPDIVEEEEE